MKKLISHQNVTCIFIPDTLSAFYFFSLVINITTFLGVVLFIDLLCGVKTVFSLNATRAGVMDAWLELKTKILRYHMQHAHTLCSPNRRGGDYSRSITHICCACSEITGSVSWLVWVGHAKTLCGGAVFTWWPVAEGTLSNDPPPSYKHGHFPIAFDDAMGGVEVVYNA